MSYCTFAIHTHPRPHPGLLHMDKYRVQCPPQHPMHPHCNTPHLLCALTHTSASSLIYTGGRHTSRMPQSRYEPLYTRYHPCVTQGDNTPPAHPAHRQTRTMAAPTLHGEARHPSHLTHRHSLPRAVLLRGTTQPHLLRADRRPLSSPPFRGGRHGPPRSLCSRSPLPSPRRAARPAPHPHRHAAHTPVPAHPRPPSADVPPAPATTPPLGATGPPAARPCGRSTAPGQRQLPSAAPDTCPPRPASPPLPALGPKRPGQPPNARRRGAAGRAGPRAHHGRGGTARPVVLATGSPEEGARCTARARASRRRCQSWVGAAPPPASRDRHRPCALGPGPRAPPRSAAGPALPPQVAP